MASKTLWAILGGILAAIAAFLVGRRGSDGRRLRDLADDASELSGRSEDSAESAEVVAGGIGAAKDAVADIAGGIGQATDGAKLAGQLRDRATEAEGRLETAERGLEQSIEVLKRAKRRPYP